MQKIHPLKPKALIMGIDRIIINANSWFEFLNQIHIDLEKHKQIYGLMKDGKVRWEDIKNDFFNFSPGHEQHIHKNEFDGSIGNIEISGDAFATIKELQAEGYIIGFVSGSVDLIVKSVADRLGVIDWYANTTLTFDDQGYWSDIEYQQAESGIKLEQALHFMKKYRLKPEEIIVLGHSQADIELFQNFPAIAVNTKNDELRQLAFEEIQYSPQIIQLLKQFEM